ncbi:chromate resistance protein ChrB domain-containing protein [Sorangium sp. So ce375]|uniref:chromate resistance protein ChrB domain-containing protein n=1 Tax=Sorangium sp. So ce375 TaxID=3133306 RepID=UPI003F5C84B5
MRALPAAAPPEDPRAGRWLLLIHQLPPKPAYLRVKIGRHLQRLGAVAIKNSVYALPVTDSAREDFAWVHREILDGGGEASVCEARFFAGLSDAQIEALFDAARNADYEALAEEVRAVQGGLPRRGRIPEERRAEVAGELARFKKQLGDIAAVDFFASTGRVAVEGLVRELEARLEGGASGSSTKRQPAVLAADVRGRTWVTRKNVHVDRIASAWLIGRFLDPEACFKLVSGKGYTPEPGELRFDMFEAEFTHEGDRCTFEVLLDRFALADPALRLIAEIVHDIDLKDAKFNRPERPGVECLVNGLAMVERDDEARLARGAALFGDLYESLARKAD